MTAMGRRLVLSIGAVLLVATGACGSDDDPGGGAEASGEADASDHGDEVAPHDDGDAAPLAFPEAEATTVVQTTLRDYAFVGVPMSVAGPNVLFKAKVAGSNTHELEVIDAGGEAVEEISGFKAGATRQLAVVLTPGTYTVRCLIKEGTRTHAQLGMRQELTVS